MDCVHYQKDFVASLVCFPQVKQLLEQNVSLKKNISSLFRTAKTELTIKNDQINMLQTRWIATFYVQYMHITENECCTMRVITGSG